MSRLRKTAGWILIAYGVVGTLDRVGYSPRTWFSDAVARMVDYFSVNPILCFLYEVFPLMMLILGAIVLAREIQESTNTF
jgi:hypothetical protein